MTKPESEVLFDELLIINQGFDSEYKSDTLKSGFRDIKILHDSIFQKRRFQNLDWLRMYKSQICKSIESSQIECQEKYKKINLICRILVQPNFHRTNKAYQKIADKYKRKINEVLYNEYDWDDIKDKYKLTASDKQRTLIALYTLVPPRNDRDLSLLLPKTPYFLRDKHKSGAIKLHKLVENPYR